MNKFNSDYTINSSRMDEWGDSVPRIFSVPGKLSTRIKKGGENELNYSHHLISSSGLISIPTQPIVVVAPETWMTGYLNGDGAVDAYASGSLTGIDVSGSLWTRITIVEAPATTTYFAGALGTANDRLYSSWTLPSAGRGYVRVSGTSYGGATPTVIPAGTLRVIQVTYRNAVPQVAMRVAASGGTSVLTAQAAGIRTVFCADACIGSSGVDYPYTGKIWGDIVYLGEPSQADIEAILAGGLPWEIWDPTLIARAWCPGAAFIDGATVKIPDMAFSHGGVHVAVDAVLRSGDINDIVIP